MTETRRQKRLRRTLEATTYRIQKAFGKTSDVYRISKLVLDVELDAYHITISRSQKSGVLDFWCDCPGFRIQKYPQSEHKHVRMAVHYRAVLGEPEHADYKFVGSGRGTKIYHDGSKI